MDGINRIKLGVCLVDRSTKSVSVDLHSLTAAENRTHLV